MIEAPNKAHIISDSILEDSDKKLLEVMKGYLIDLLLHAYTPLVDQVFSEISKNSEMVEELDRYHYFYLSTFMIKVCRLKA